MIRVVARDHLAPGKKAEALEIYRPLIEKTRSQKGCIMYTLNESTSDPNALCMLECWETEEDIQAHISDKEFIETVGKLSALFDQKTVIETYRDLL